MPEYRQVPFNPPASTLATVLFGVTIVAALYFGREVLVPIALAILLSFILAPLVRITQRLRIPQILAVLAVVAVAFAIILGLGAVIVTQVNQSGRRPAALRDDASRKDPELSRHRRGERHARAGGRGASGPRQGNR